MIDFVEFLEEEIELKLYKRRWEYFFLNDRTDETEDSKLNNKFAVYLINFAFK